MIFAFNTVLGSLEQLAVHLINALPKVIIVIAIWLIGKYLIGLATKLIKKIDIKDVAIDDYLINILSLTVSVVGKAFLILVILDYLGIGQNVVGAIANGLTLAIAIALGLAFGKALEADAGNIVETLKKHLKTKE